MPNFILHEAAKDGYLELLNSATRREANQKDEDGMTPLMWASSKGNVEALRVLTSRGANVDKADNSGWTALHHSVANGHEKCVEYLVNIGANFWNLDNDLRTPMQLAAVFDRIEIVRYLDMIVAQQSALHKNSVRSLKEVAEKKAKKRLKRREKVLEKLEKNQKDQVKNKNNNSKVIDEGILKDDLSESFSQHVGLSNKGTVISRIFAGKSKSKQPLNGTTREKVTLKKTKTELQADGANSACSAPAELGSNEQTSSLFERPGLGSMIIINKIKASLDGVNDGRDDADSIGTARSLAVRLNNFQADVDDQDQDEEEECSALELFLEVNNLHEILPKLTQERIEAKTLISLEEKDIDEMGFPLGIKKKLLAAIKERKECFKNSAILIDNQL
ncbi:DgyrCDS2447 [Dimorphilus gyrociliatus]|uniref:DgyrCDS2447 n=1 Tax=Dimorphilus gyrociliatus TaxID=2664684 RepID=A0A7I8VBM8_9ANNE|nr:DgyrCDS2447 [Dimorphilus gyrociliatus]